MRSHTQRMFMCSSDLCACTWKRYLRRQWTHLGSVEQVEKVCENILLPLRTPFRGVAFVAYTGSCIKLSTHLFDPHLSKLFSLLFKRRQTPPDDNQTADQAGFKTRLLHVRRPSHVLATPTESHRGAPAGRSHRLQESLRRSGAQPCMGGLERTRRRGTIHTTTHKLPRLATSISAHRRQKQILPPRAMNQTG